MLNKDRIRVELGLIEDYAASLRSQTNEGTAMNQLFEATHESVDRPGHWDMRAPSYPDAIARCPLRKLILNSVQKELCHASRESRILDIGCGTGELLRQLRDAGFHSLFGTDFSPKMLRLCANSFGSGDVELQVCDVRDLPFGESILRNL